MHKYTTTFDFEVTACEEIGGINISNANIDNLKSLIPSSVDLDKNIDLMGVAFNAAVVNEFNKNGDGMSRAPRLQLIQFNSLFISRLTSNTIRKKSLVTSSMLVLAIIPTALF